MWDSVVILWYEWSYDRRSDAKKTTWLSWIRLKRGGNTRAALYVEEREKGGGKSLVGVSSLSAKVRNIVLRLGNISSQLRSRRDFPCRVQLVRARSEQVEAGNVRGKTRGKSGGSRQEVFSIRIGNLLCQWLNVESSPARTSLSPVAI